MTNEELETKVAEVVAASEARWEAERAARRAEEQERAAQEATAWRDAVAPVAIACGVRPIFIEQLAVQARAVFDLRDGKVVAKPGTVHPTDPCRDYTLADWLGGLRATDDNLLFPK